MKFKDRLLLLNARVSELAEFIELSAPVKWRRPEMQSGEGILPAVARAGFLPPTGVRFNKTAGATPRARAAGIIYTRPSTGSFLAKEVGRSELRHELTHSIQAAKRGYAGHSRIRDLIKDEVGAYSTQYKRVAPGSMLNHPVVKIARKVDAGIGIVGSSVLGVAGNPRLRERALVYGAGAALAGAVAYKALHKKKEEKPNE